MLVSIFHFNSTGRKELYMKRMIQFILCGVVLTGAISCKKYLDIVPKGQKIPQSFEDYKALVESADGHMFEYESQNQVANDFYIVNSQQSAVTLANLNYNWQEDKERMQFLNVDRGYNAAYKGIFMYNVLINNIATATTGSAADKARLAAQAKIGRSMLYFYLVTSYAKMYDAATAAQDRGVLLNTADNMSASLKQLSVKEIYDFILNDIHEALPALPENAEDPLFANKAAGFAFLSRVNLFMKNYDQAAVYADSALKRNNALFDYVAYYNQNKVLADGTSPSINIPRFEFKSPENYIFHYGGEAVKRQGFYICMLRPSDSTQYDRGDARFKVNYALVNFGEKILAYRRMDDVNGGGIRTPEMYYTKAECLARAGKLAEAMEALNTVRRKRIIPELYSDVTAKDLPEAMALIRRELKCEYRGTGLVYLTLRRLNNDSQFRATITKTEGSKTYSITPDSRIWIMPFSATAVNYSNGLLIQNSK
jgi:hypothetical protein